MTFIERTRGRKHRVITAAVALAASALVLAGCTATGPGGGTPSGAANYNIVVMPKSLGNKYFAASDAGAKSAIEGFNGTYTEAGSNEASPTSQSPFIQTAIQNGAGAIILAANDPEAVCADLKDAMAAGVKVVTFDSDTNCRDAFINQATVDGVAQGLVDLAVKNFGTSNAVQIAIVSGGPNATNLNAWVDSIKAKLVAQAPNIQVVDVVYGNDVDADAYNAVKGVITAHPELDGIIAPDSVSVKEAAHYLQDTPALQDTIWLTGLGLPSELRDYIKAGVFDQFGLWDVGALGQLAAYTAKALIDGEITGAEGDTFTTPLGDYTVGKGGEIVLGPLFVFDKSNVDNFDF
ncbi:MAG: substrate-binding domain-containing protein [Pseudolysinimonas sp.]|uniref:substrate-binding domain-containing protein n=1 Tax=Pseudolysinimonas sp. TaxID=2680009 RepID=UPI003266EAFC